MNTITETRSQDKQTPFGKALELWRSRCDALDAALVGIDAETEDALSELLSAAERDLIRQPVRTPSDLRALAQVIWQDPDSSPSRDMLAALFNGLRNLDDGQSRTFNPAQWLGRFEKLGGGWIVKDGATKLVRPTDQSDGMACHWWGLETRDGLDAVLAVIDARPKDAEPVTSWADVLADYRTANAVVNALAVPADDAPRAEHSAYEAKLDGLVDMQTAAMQALFAFPSPDRSALAEKAKLFASEQLHQWNDAGEFSGIIATEAARLAA